MLMLKRLHFSIPLYRFPHRDPLPCPCLTCLLCHPPLSLSDLSTLPPSPVPVWPVHSATLPCPSDLSTLPCLTCPLSHHHLCLCVQEWKTVEPSSRRVSNWIKHSVSGTGSPRNDQTVSQANAQFQTLFLCVNPLSVKSTKPVYAQVLTSGQNVVILIHDVHFPCIFNLLKVFCCWEKVILMFPASMPGGWGGGGGCQLPD